MKISERKQRLRARGTVPVPQETASRRKAVSAPARAQDRRTTTAGKGAAPQRAARPRWQPSPTYQMGFGLLYIVFSPFLFYTNWVAVHAPALPHHPKPHIGTTELVLYFGMPAVFFLFGVWWFYRGFQARRRQANSAAGGAGAPQARKPEPVKRPSR